MQVEMKQMPELRVAALRHTGPYTTMAPTFGRLSEIAGRARLFERPGAVLIAVFHDDPDNTPADKLRSDVGIVVPDGTAIPDGLTEARVPGGRFASTVHIGPYETLPPVWAEFMAKHRPPVGE